MLAQASAQTPGEWKYTITTLRDGIPEDMRVNFPTVSFSACRTGEDFVTGRAFALQTLASSESRCQSANYQRTKSIRGDDVAFEFSCDEAKSLVGRASGKVNATGFEFALTTIYPQPISGVSQVKQSMRGERKGDCKVKPDSDELKTQ